MVQPKCSDLGPLVYFGFLHYPSVHYIQSLIKESYIMQHMHCKQNLGFMMHGWSQFHKKKTHDLKRAFIDVDTIKQGNKTSQLSMV